MIDLDKLMELHNKATKGPWEIREDTEMWDGWDEHQIYSVRNSKYDEAASEIYEKDDAVYIVAACNSIPDLIHRIRELEEEVESLRDALKESESRQRSLLTDEEWAWIVRNA